MFIKLLNKLELLTTNPRAIAIRVWVVLLVLSYLVSLLAGAGNPLLGFVSIGILIFTPIFSLYIYDSIKKDLVNDVTKTLFTMYGFALISVPHVFSIIYGIGQSAPEKNQSLYWLYLFLPVIGLVFNLLALVSAKKNIHLNLSLMLLMFYYSGFIIFFVSTIISEFVGIV